MLHCKTSLTSLARTRDDVDAGRLSAGVRRGHQAHVTTVRPLLSGQTGVVSASLVEMPGSEAICECQGIAFSTKTSGEPVHAIYRRRLATAVLHLRPSSTILPREEVFGYHFKRRKTSVSCAIAHEVQARLKEPPFQRLQVIQIL